MLLHYNSLDKNLRDFISKTEIWVKKISLSHRQSPKHLPQTNHHVCNTRTTPFLFSVRGQPSTLTMFCQEHNGIYINPCPQYSSMRSKTICGHSVTLLAHPQPQIKPQYRQYSTKGAHIFGWQMKCHQSSHIHSFIWSILKCFATYLDEHKGLKTN